MKRVLFIFLLLALSACSIQPTLLAPTSTFAASLHASSTPAPSLVPSATPLPTQTSIPVPAYPPPPEMMATTTVQITDTPEATNAQFGMPLSPEVTGPIDGPWLIYAIGSQGIPDETLAVSDLAGEWRYGIELSAPPSLVGSHWNVILPARGNFMAARRMSPRISIDDPGYEIWLFSLTEGRLVRKIPQFSEEALLEIRKSPTFFPRGEFFGHPILSAINVAPAWSPDGRYLAFSAAMEGPDVNLYLYDTQTDRIRQLTYQVHQARFRSWSPDGRYIIYNQEIGSESYFDQGSWMLELNTGQSWYLSRLRVKDHFQWMTAESILVAETGNETPSFDLRRLDISTGQEKLLYSKTYSSLGFEPTLGVIILTKANFAYGFWPDDERGIYRLFEDGSEKKLISGDYDEIYWNAALGLFTAVDPIHLDAIAFDLYGVEKLRFPGAAPMEISPDGKWIAAKGNLYHSDGTLAAPIGSPYPIFWAPDSATFFQATPAGDLLLFRMSDDWKGEIIDSQPQIGLLGIVQRATN